MLSFLEIPTKKLARPVGARQGLVLIGMCIDEEFGLGSEPRLRLATIMRSADTARPIFLRKAPGVLAKSSGLSRMYAADDEQFEADLLLYDLLRMVP
jgi:hypothetical protein